MSRHELEELVDVSSHRSSLKLVRPNPYCDFPGAPAFTETDIQDTIFMSPPILQRSGPFFKRATPSQLIATVRRSTYQQPSSYPSSGLTPSYVYGYTKHF